MLIPRRRKKRLCPPKTLRKKLDDADAIRAILASGGVDIGDVHREAGMVVAEAKAELKRERKLLHGRKRKQYILQGGGVSAQSQERKQRQRAATKREINAIMERPVAGAIASVTTGKGEAAEILTGAKEVAAECCSWSERRMSAMQPKWFRRLDPLHRIRHQLARWTRVSLCTVIRGGQRTLNGYVTRARGATKRTANDDDDGAVPATSKQRREDAPTERPQRQPSLRDALKRAAAAAAATAASAAASADELTTTAATAPQTAGAKRGSDTQAAAPNRPTASA